MGVEPVKNILNSLILLETQTVVTYFMAYAQVDRERT